MEGSGIMFLLVLLFIATVISGVLIPRSAKSRFLSVSMNYGFIYTPKVTDKPKLILISGIYRSFFQKTQLLYVYIIYTTLIY